MKEFDEIFRSDSGYVSCKSCNLVYLEDFHSGIPKLFEGNFHQGIKVHIIYFSLTDISISTVIILFSIHLPCIYTHLRARLMNLCGICNLFA